MIEEKDEIMDENNDEVIDQEEIDAEADVDTDDLDEEVIDGEGGKDKDTIDEEDDEDDEDNDSIKVSTEEYNEFRKQARILKKLQEEQIELLKEKAQGRQKETEDELTAKLKEKFPKYKVEDIKVINSIVKEAVSEISNPIKAESKAQLTEQKLVNYLTTNKIDEADADHIYNVYKTSDSVRKALEDKILAPEDLYKLYDYNRLKKQLNDKKVNNENKDNLNKVKGNTGGKKGIKEKTKAKKYTAEDISNMSISEYSKLEEEGVFN